MVVAWMVVPDEIFGAGESYVISDVVYENGVRSCVIKENMVS